MCRPAGPRSGVRGRGPMGACLLDLYRQEFEDDFCQRGSASTQGEASVPSPHGNRHETECQVEPGRGQGSRPLLGLSFNALRYSVGVTPRRRLKATLSAKALA